MDALEVSDKAEHGATEEEEELGASLDRPPEGVVVERDQTRCNHFSLYHWEFRATKYLLKKALRFHMFDFNRFFLHLNFEYVVKMMKPEL